MTRKKLLLFLPFLAVFLLAGVFAAQLLYFRTLSRPSLIEGKPAPNVSFPNFEGGEQINPESFKGKVTVLNVFASWCPPCIQEHPHLMEIAKDKRIEMVGINYKDKSENAKRFLNSHGNPYTRIGVDEKGRNAIEWGVYGIPETFIIGRDGKVAYKYIGPITKESYETKIKIKLEEALSKPANN